MKDKLFGGGGYRSRFAKKKNPFTIHKEYNIGTSRFIENKTMHFGKSYFMATMGISIHEEKISISHFMSNKKAQSEVRKILISTFINVNLTNFIVSRFICKNSTKVNENCVHS